MRTLHRSSICALFTLLLTTIALGQQDYIGRYDVYTGYMYLNSPVLNLGESGFHTQVETNPAKWYTLGFDFCIGRGDTNLATSMMKASVQQQISQQLSAFGMTLAAIKPVPEHSRTEEFAMGPAIDYRHFRALTLFIHPDLGAIHEAAIPITTNLTPLDKMLVAEMAPSGTKEQWVYFYGVGGGVDVNATRHVGLRFTVDVVHDHLFGDLINPRNTVRFSVGPSFHMGKNLAAQK